MVLAQVTSAANKLGHKKQNAQSLVTACFLATFELYVCNNAIMMQFVCLQMMLVVEMAKKGDLRQFLLSLRPE